MALIDSFLSDAATHLPATINKTSLQETWKLTHPNGTPSNIDEYLADLISHTYYYAFYHHSPVRPTPRPTTAKPPTQPPWYGGAGPKAQPPRPHSTRPPQRTRQKSTETGCYRPFLPLGQ